MVEEKKVIAEVLDPEEFSEEIVEAFIGVIKSRGRFYTVNELEEKRINAFCKPSPMFHSEYHDNPPFIVLGSRGGYRKFY